MQWLEIIAYMDQNKRRPSKHRIEDHKMVNWIKYNKKRMAAGELPEERVDRLNLLLQIAQRYRRLNQYAYLSSSSDDD